MKKIISIILSILVVSVLFRFFVGVYTHDEFAENHMFIKYRPTWHRHFYSPIGQSDSNTNELSNDEKIEQDYWNEFVVGRFEIE